MSGNVDPFVPLWDGSIGLPPPEPPIEMSLGERRARCIYEILLLSELIEAHAQNPAAAKCLHYARNLRAKLLFWMYRYCNYFEAQ